MSSSSFLPPPWRVPLGVLALSATMIYLPTRDIQVPSPPPSPPSTRRRRTRATDRAGAPAPRPPPPQRVERSNQTGVTAEQAATIERLRRDALQRQAERAARGVVAPAATSTARADRRDEP